MILNGLPQSHTEVIHRALDLLFPNRDRILFVCYYLKDKTSVEAPDFNYFICNLLNYFNTYTQYLLIPPAPL